MFYITLEDVRVPVIETVDSVYMGLSEIKKFYQLKKPTHNDVLLECRTYIDLMGKASFPPNKLFVSRVGAVLLFEFNNVHYTCYWYIFCIIDNIINNRDSGTNGVPESCATLLENIQKDVTVIKRYVTVNPFE
uniref:Uncharacterized protein n=1 Tax=Erinnyis ello granulovirus TaxID=307444 RepID=A0A288WI28_9BBAC|nr:hypothetical protein EREL_018 [Erinnyis ello granulovirus]